MCVVVVQVTKAPKEPSATVIHPQTRAAIVAAEAADIYNDIRRKGSLYITSTPGSVRGDEAPPYTNTTRKRPRPR